MEQCNEHQHVVESLKEIKTDIKEILKLHNGNGKMGYCAKTTIMWNSTIFLVIAVTGLLIKAAWAHMVGV